MSWQYDFDPDASAVSERACINDALQRPGSEARTYAVAAASSGSPTVTTLKPGIYRVHLDGRDGAVTVALQLAADDTPVAGVPAAGSSATTVVFAGDETVRLRVSPAMPKLTAQLSSGSKTLFLVPLVQWKA